MKRLTARQLAKIDDKIEAHAAELLKKYTPEQTAMIIWNKYGYLSGTKNGKVTISGSRKIVVG